MAQKRRPFKKRSTSSSTKPLESSFVKVVRSDCGFQDTAKLVTEANGDVGNTYRRSSNGELLRNGGRVIPIFVTIC